MLYDYLKKLFVRTTPKTQETNSFVTFQISDKQIVLSCEWQKETEEIASSIASLFYCMNRGLLLSQILDQLVNQGLNNPEKQIFINQIIAKWRQFQTVETSILDLPLVPPMRAFKDHAK